MNLAMFLKRLKKRVFLYIIQGLTILALNTVEPPNTAALGSWDWRKTAWYGVTYLNPMSSSFLRGIGGLEGSPVCCTKFYSGLIWIQ